jgi:hypothetical protein
MPRKLIRLQFILILALAAAVSGCGSSSTTGEDSESRKVLIRDIGDVYTDYLNRHQKPPTKPEDLQEMVDKSETKKIVDVLTDGRITVIWKAAPMDQEGNADSYILVYETNPGRSGKRWVYLAKRGRDGMANRWLANESTTVEFTAEEFEKAAKAKPSP